MKSKNQTAQQHKVARLIIVLALVLGLGALGLLFGRSTLVNAWQLATTRQPERFTTLSFNDTGHLPTYSPALQPQTISFHLANHENAAITYHYVVLVDAGNANTVADEGYITLKDGASFDKKFLFTVPAPATNARITVQLIGRPEYITFETRS